MLAKKYLLGAMVVAGSFIAGAVLGISSAPTAYPEYRQQAFQEIPGALFLTLDSPGRYQPAVTPEQAIAVASQGQQAPDAVYLTLAEVPGYYSRTVEPQVRWVIFARKVCFAAAKGDLVSGRNQETDERGINGCSVKNIWIQMVDPVTGERKGVVRAWDPTSEWAPRNELYAPAG